MKPRTFVALATTVITGAVGVYLAAGMTALDYAAKRNPKAKAKNSPSYTHEVPEDDQKWIDHQTFRDVSIHTFDGLTMKAKFLEHRPKTNKYIIAVHGYHTSNIKEFAYYLRYLYDLGFNILLPDNRAHGESEGDYIGFGWLDRLDILEWIHSVQAHQGFQPTQIVLFGISMGGSAVLMASGENLPDDVKCIISDCSYTTAEEEFKNVLKRHHIPSWLIMPAAKLVSRKKLGFDFTDASAVDQVKKSKTPTLFIHGDKDTLVPDIMVHELYDACSAEKDLLIMKGATHADSYITNRPLYEKTVSKFINKYVK